MPAARLPAAAAAFVAAVALAAAADPTPDQLKRADATFRDAFGKEYDKAAKAKTPADKVAFARKLWDATKTVADDPALVRLLGDKAAALGLLAEPAGLPLVLEIRRARVTDGKDRPDQLAAVAAVLDRQAKAEKAADKKLKFGAEAVELLREAAALSHEAGRETEAVGFLTKAGFAARAHLPAARQAAALKDLAADRAEFDADKKQAAEVDRLAAVLRSSPADPKANQGMALITLRAGRPADAVGYLRASGVERLRQVGNLYAQRNPPADPVHVGDVLRAAADEFPADKVLFLTLARQQYEAALIRDPKGPEAARMRLLVKEWQSLGGRVGALTELIDEDPAAAAAFARAESGAAKVEWDPGVGHLSSGSMKVSTTSPGSPQVKHGAMAGWKFPITESPVPGEYRFLRFAVKMRGGTYAYVNFGSPQAVASYAVGKPGTDARVYAVAAAPPGDWVVVTRDLFADVRGPIELSMLKVETDGEVWLDGVYLARAARDLSKLTPKPPAGGK